MTRTTDRVVPGLSIWRCDSCDAFAESVHLPQGWSDDERGPRVLHLCDECSAEMRRVRKPQSKLPCGWSPPREVIDRAALAATIVWLVAGIGATALIVWVVVEWLL